MSLATTLKLVEFEYHHPVRPGLELFGQVGPSLAQGLKDTLKQVTDLFRKEEGQYQGLSGDLKKSLNAVKVRDYVTLMDVTVPVPIGFKGDLIGYGRHLVGANDLIAEHLKGIDHLKRTLAFILTNPTVPVDVNNGVPTHDEIEALKDRQSQDIARFIDPSKGASVLRFGSCVNRNNDWPTVLDIATELDLFTTKHNNKHILADADEVDRLLGKLIDRQKTGKLTNIDTDVVRELASVVYSVATMLEYYAVNFYRAQAYVQSVDNIAKKLNEVTKLK